MIRTAHGIGQLEFHPNPKLDAYLYYGAEYAMRAAYRGYNIITITKTPAIPPTPTSPAIPATTTTTIKVGQFGGYGSPFANNSGCSTENPPANQLTPSGGGTCAGDTRIITEATFGFWHKFYQGPKGGLRWGAQYSYFSKNGYSTPWTTWYGLRSATTSRSPETYWFRLIALRESLALALPRGDKGPANAIKVSLHLKTYFRKAA